MRVYLQQRNGSFPNINYYAAFLGFQERGHEVVLFEEATWPALPITADEMVAGEIPFVLSAFAKLGIDYTYLPYIPLSLLPLAGRRTWTSTLGEVRNIVASGQALFAKPLHGTPRLFKGQVFRAYRDLVRTAHFPAETPVWCSELVDFVSEYRAFICEGEFIGLQYYAGDFRVFPDWPTMERALAAYVEPPAGFALDFGVTRTGEALIVEQNDGFSLGCYGLHPVAYARLLEVRWEQLKDTRGGGAASP